MHWLAGDHLLFSCLGLLSLLDLFDLLSLLREFQISHELLLALLDDLFLLFNLLNRAEAQLGELESSLGSALAMSSIDGTCPVLNVAPEIVGVVGEADVAVGECRTVGLRPNMTIQKDGSDIDC